MTAATVESAWAVMGGDLIKLAEQQLVSCTTEAEGAYGCDGAYPWAGFTYYMDSKLSVTETDMPYTATNGTCTASDYTSTAVQVSSWNWVATKSNTQIMGALNQSPIGISVNASCYFFQLYKDGVFSGEDCANQSSDLDHAVTLVGYGTDDTSNLNYFILRNSWGTSWGMEGYMNIENTSGNGPIGMNLEPIIPQTTNYNSSDFASSVSSIAAFTAATLALVFTF